MPAPPRGLLSLDSPTQGGGLLQAPPSLRGGLLSGYGGQQAAQTPKVAALGMTPQEMNLWKHHTSNLKGGKVVTNKDGSISTVRQLVVTGPDGRFYSIPSVWDGRVLDAPAALDRAMEAGWDQWPAYDTPDEADARYQLMHKFMEMK